MNRREAKLCVDCSKPAVPGITRCQSCREKVNTRSKLTWRKYRNPGKYNKQHREYRERIRKQVLDYYGAFCVCCGEDTSLFLTIDHIHENGHELRRTLKGHNHIYKWLLKHGYPEGYQVLCMNCNFGKMRNKGICPHLSIETRV
jgi:hypothetical protein